MLVRLPAARVLRNVFTAAALLAAGVAVTASGAPVASIRSVGTLRPDNNYSEADGISGDGTTAVGNAGDGQIYGFKWTSLGIVNLGDSGGAGSRAFATNGDGSVIVGTNHIVAAWWRPGVGLQQLPDLPGGDARGAARAVSADGTIVAGIGNEPRPSGGSRTKAVRWVDGVVQDLGDVGGIGSAAYGISADGNTVVGMNGNGGIFTQAARWVGGDGGLQLLGDLPGGSDWGIAYAADADGSVIVGQSNSTAGDQAFRWTPDGGMVGLGDIPGGGFMSEARAVSADGSIVVGRSWGATGYEAAIWDAHNGMRSLRDVLIAHGVDMTNWRLDNATGISADGTVITGNGGLRGFVAVLPEPTTLGLLAIAGPCLLRRRVR